MAYSLVLMLVSLVTALAGPAPRAAAASRADTVRYVVAAEGNEVRYRVREQLADLDFPNDAVGATDRIRGSLTLDGDGAVVPAASRFVVELDGLTSDRERRDGYIKRRTLDTGSYPLAVLTPTAVRGLPTPLPVSGEHIFQLEADLTVRNETRPTVWEVSATFDGAAITGTAATRITFDDFNLTKPSLAFILGVADTVALEYDFRLEAGR